MWWKNVFGKKAVIGELSCQVDIEYTKITALTELEETG